jgi:hypothetical protein
MGPTSCVYIVQPRDCGESDLNDDPRDVNLFRLQLQLFTFPAMVKMSKMSVIKSLNLFLDTIDLFIGTTRSRDE